MHTETLSDRSHDPPMTDESYRETIRELRAEVHGWMEDCVIASEQRDRAEADLEALRDQVRGVVDAVEAGCDWLSALERLKDLVNAVE